MSTIKLTGMDQHIDLTLEDDVFSQPNLDIGPIKQAGWFCYDPGLTLTTACQSGITWLDGAKGRLLYRGYPIEQLAEHYCFTQVIYLLLFGELPSEAEHNAFTDQLSTFNPLPENTLKLVDSLPKHSHPMAILSSLAANLSVNYHHGENDYKNPDVQQEAVLRMIAQIPSMVALSNRHTQGLGLDAFNSQYGKYTEQFTYNVLAKSATDTPTKELVEALDKIFILHADHELNASTFTVRTAGSTGTNPYACLSAGLAALWGPAHGGANEACLNMLKAIGSTKNIATYIQRAKDKEDPFKLMGFGHRVYKNYDPRAKIMRQICHQTLDIMNQKDHPLFDLALELERVALEDPYFVDKKLYPNIDFYSGITLSAMGIPSELFTPIFALARTTGWLSHWLEMYQTKPFKITRPRQWYVGPSQRDVPKD